MTATATACLFNSSILIHTSSSSLCNSYYNCNTNPNISFPFGKHSNYRCIIRAVQDGAPGILSLDHVVDDGTPVTQLLVPQQDQLQLTPKKRLSKKKQVDDDDDGGDDTRFKLRNGREVGVFLLIYLFF